MPAMMPATPQQIVELRRASTQFEAYASQVSRAVVGRYLFWASLKQDTARAGVSAAQLVGPELAQVHERADAAARQWATVIRSLDTGRAQLAGWTVPGEAGPQALRLGVVVAGTLPTSLSLFPLVPIIVYAVAGGLAVGTWLLTDAWLDARKLEAETGLIVATTRSKISATIAAIAATNPAAAAAVADAVVKANASAGAPQTKGILDKLADLVPDLPSAGDLSGLAWILVGYFLLRGRGRA